MNLNLNTSRIAAAVLGTGIALGATACGSASGKTSEAPEAPESAVQNVGSEPKSDNEPSQQCYPLEGRHAEIELYYADADGLDVRPRTACFIK